MTLRAMLAHVVRLIAVVLLLGSPTIAAAGRTPHKPHRPHQPKRPRKCRNDSQCPDNDVCNAAGVCCNTFAGAVACGSLCCDTLFGNQSCCGNICANLKSDNANCGSCGNQCTGGQTCTNGACGCPEGTVDCGGTCVDTTFDNQNCGGCRNGCKDGQTCVDSACSCDAAVDVNCNGECVNPLVDDANCGGCGHACGSGQSCAGGACVCSNSDDIFCNGQCVDGRSSPIHCGQCGTICGDGEQCVDGQCQGPCTPCQDLVNGVCVPKDCGPGGRCFGDGQCYQWCQSPNVPCGSLCLPPGDTDKCCDDRFTCHADEQCARGGCCEAGTTVCESTNGSTYSECCDPGWVCVQDGAGWAGCCIPGLGEGPECGTAPGKWPAICCMQYP